MLSKVVTILFFLNISIEMIISGNLNQLCSKSKQ